MESEYASQYEHLSQHHWWWRARSRKLANVLRFMDLPATTRILDVGCGSGVNFGLLEQFGTVEGVEVDETLVRVSNARGDLVHHASFNESFRPPHSYSLLTMLDVIEHLADPFGAMRHAAELLEPGGYVLITVPAMPMLWTRHDELNHHHCRYTRATLKRLVEQTGFETKTLDYFFHWLAPLKLAVRAKEKLISSPARPPKVPAAPVNAVLEQVSRIENRLFSKVSLPFGTSLICVARVMD